VSEPHATSARARPHTWSTSVIPPLFALSYVALRTAIEPWEAARQLELTRGSGWVALATLLVSLCCTPVARLTARLGHDRRPTFSSLRRALGMTSAWLALLHASIAFAIPLQWNWSAVVHWPHLRAGVTALLVLIVLLATSFTPVSTRLRLKFFKQLHRLGYVAALLSLQHLLLSPFAPRALTLELFAAVLLLALTRLAPARS
jgi:DMSO/TMAO reductase YedYZ heme-binding membrane subunit